MRRIIGFAIFFIGIGMIIKMLIQNNFISVCVIIGLLVLGYNLFVGGNCKNNCK